MRSDSVYDLLDAKGDTIERAGRLPIPGLSPEVIQSLRQHGNDVAALAATTTDKEYIKLQRHRNVLSNSIGSTLAACPRKLVLEKIEANNRDASSVGVPDNLDFVFGHSVGAGVQALFAFDRLDAGLYASFLSWYCDWSFGHEDYLQRKNKTIEKAVLAVEAFSYFRQSPELADWELLRIDSGGAGLYSGGSIKRYEVGTPAIELSFCLDLGRSRYFGHIDLVLRNKRTGRIAVGEIKTTGYSNPDEAIYRNSGQALGYSLILDQVVGVEADYDVLYLVYSAPKQEWTFLPFSKSRFAKLEWVQDRLIETGHLQQYFKLEHFPKNGASCMAFNRRCQFFGTCDLVSKEKMRALPEMSVEEAKNSDVDYYFNVEELIGKQLELEGAEE